MFNKQNIFDTRTNQKLCVDITVLYGTSEATVYLFCVKHFLEHSRLILQFSSHRLHDMDQRLDWGQLKPAWDEVFTTWQCVNRVWFKEASVLLLIMNIILVISLHSRWNAALLHSIWSLWHCETGSVLVPTWELVLFIMQSLSLMDCKHCFIISYVCSEHV